MSLKKRYQFYKEIYPKYLILFLKKKDLTSINSDKEILKLLKGLEQIETKQINYILIDNLKIIKRKTFKENKYQKYRLIKDIIKITNC